ncbi:MAG TPA: hypothetical protein DEB16_02730 [Ruminococcaceae bacterium]|jgi:selenocysteine lyase/cysteine desulfurase|nr:hypothetical protein [Oscillospiraceae bacterium]HBG55041.1 hypothetical protein [Oscillospiraceae bacterium]HBQ46233.1 hypothetical protein [Oscillospiraceae bacterium]HBT90746.1 hypothetical protein [Oscillospiraceae bacterium]
MISSPWRHFFWGTDARMRTNYGRTARVFLNNAATPLIARPVTERVRRMLPRYASGGEPDRISEAMREQCGEIRAAALDYVGGDPERDAAVYVPSATAAINLLSCLFLQSDPDQVVLSTRMEHLANFLPFRERFETALVELTSGGAIDLNDYHRLLVKYEGRVRLVAVTGGSNITGEVPPVHRMAQMAHEYGARILVDAVQLVQHRPFSMLPHDDPRHIDFLCFDGHKCYTGRSGGMLIGPKDFLDSCRPAVYGAGIADFVSDKEIAYRGAPDRFEAGYPDFPGMLSLGEALGFLKRIGVQRIAEYEGNLYRYLLRRLREVPGLRLYGAAEDGDRLPIAAFCLKGVGFRELGDALGYDYGIAAAAGTCGANLYVQDLLRLSNTQACALFRGGKEYGVARVSLAPFNSSEDIDRLAAALRRIAGA